MNGFIPSKVWATAHTDEQTTYQQISCLYCPENIKPPLEIVFINGTSICKKHAQQFLDKK